MARRAALAAAVVVVVVVAAVAVIWVLGRESVPGAGRGTPLTSDPVPSTSAPPAVDVLAVKIDNVRAARPQTGLGAAAVVYVEPVEGGLTRLLALYTGNRPAVVGPVRSARRTDLHLLAQWGKPTLGYSGAAPELLPAIRGADLTDASEGRVPRAYYRDQSRGIPHNLYLRPARLPTATTAHVPLQFGPAPAGGTSATTHTAAFESARFDFTWSGGRWLVSLDGTPLTSTESGRVGAATVVHQRVKATADESVEDASGFRSPVVTGIGEGSAVVLRDGKRFAVTWSRPSAASPTTFHTTAGDPVPLASGPVWILLTPA